MAIRPTPSGSSVSALGALVLGTVLALTSCTAPSGDATSSGADAGLTVTTLQEYSTPPDPDVNYDGPGLNIIENTYEGLVAYADGVHTATIVPELATVWTVSDDGLVYTFTLRNGVTFHDGTPFTAEAVKASFARRTQVDGGPAYMVGGVASVDAADPRVAVVTLSAPNSAFLDYLASPFGVKMISPTVLRNEAGTDFAQTYLTTHDAGTGPYQLSSAETGTRYALTAFPGYWGEAPKITEVELVVTPDASSAQLQLERGETDAILGNLNKTSFESLVAGDSVTTTTFPNFTTQNVYVNPQSSIFTTLEDRATLFRAIDSTTVIANAMGALEVPTTQLFPQKMLDSGLDDQGVSYDPAAVTSLVSSGIATGKTIRIGFPASSADGQAVAEELGATLSSAGLPSEAVSLAAGTAYTMTEDLAAAPDIFIMSVFPDAGHPDSWARIVYTPDGGLDLFGAEVDGLADMLDTALSTSDIAAYGPIARSVIDAKWWLSIGSLQTTFVSQPDVQGLDQASNLLEYNVLHFSALSRG